MLLVNDSFIL